VRTTRRAIRCYAASRRDGEEMGGFNPTMHAMTQILSREILWELPKAEEAETPKVVIN
jgi:hypothetical protein